MNEQTTVSKLRKEKNAELKAVLKKIGGLEVGRVPIKRGGMGGYLGMVKALDKLYLRRRSLKNFLKELSGDHRLILSTKDVMGLSED